MSYRTDYQTTACPRCGVVGCSSPDEKACSDNCITRLYAKLAESPPLAERVQAALTDDVLWEARRAFEEVIQTWKDTEASGRLSLVEWTALRREKAHAAMRAVLLAALAPTTPQE